MHQKGRLIARVLADKDMKNYVEFLNSKERLD
jgi:hypothetical protein